MDFTKIRNYLFLGFLGLVTVLFVWVLKPLMYPIFWAAVLATLFYPLYKKIDRRLKHPNLSTTITISLIGILILLPLAIIAVLLVRESFSLFTTFNGNGQVSTALRNLSESLQHNRYIGPIPINENLVVEKISQITQTIVTFIFDSASYVTQNSVIFLIMFLLTLYALFFFLRDGEKILRKLMYVLPLGDRYEVKLYNRFTATARAALKGTLVVGAIQGSLGSILFAVAGVPGAIIWGLMMVFFSILPGLGTSIIWVPVGIIMLLIGNTWQGITILVVGTVVISTIDNITRPLVVGKDMQMHPLLILFSTLGGIAAFGLSGLVVGPVVAALFMSFWEMYEEYYRAELSHN